MVATVEKPRRRTSGTRARRQNTRLTVADIDRFFRPAQKNRTAARNFLRKIGVEVQPDGTVKVRPL